METIKVMTFNIHHGKGMDKHVDLKRISEVITSSNADIIGLNEVDKKFSKRSHFVDQIESLANELNFYYAFSPSITNKSDNQYGNGVLSRYPLISNKNQTFNFFPRFVEGRSLLEATVEVNQKPVNIYVTHLSLHPYLHRLQTEMILRRVRNPAIILGDWNMKPNSKRWERVIENYVDVWNEFGKGAGNTYPSPKPRTRLDYIFVSKEIKILSTEIYDKIPIASDHLPLLATFLI